MAERLTSENVLVQGYGNNIKTHIMPNALTIDNVAIFLTTFKKEFGTQIVFIEDGSFLINGCFRPIDLNIFLNKLFAENDGT